MTEDNKLGDIQEETEPPIKKISKVEKFIFKTLLFLLIFCLYYFSFKMFKTDHVSLGRNYKEQEIAIGWAWTAMIATVFLIMAIYITDLYLYIPFLRPRKDSSTNKTTLKKLSRTERRVKERSMSKK